MTANDALESTDFSRFRVPLSKKELGRMVDQRVSVEAIVDVHAAYDNSK